MAEYRLRWSARARQDLNNIQQYIDQDNPVAAARTVLRVVQQTGRIKAFPLSFEAIQPDRPEYRSMIIKPFAVIYKVAPDEVIVLRVIHTSMKWK